jgi:hypothetical protein
LRLVFSSPERAGKERALVVFVATEKAKSHRYVGATFCGGLAAVDVNKQYSMI